MKIYLQNNGWAPAVKESEVQDEVNVAKAEKWKQSDGTQGPRPQLSKILNTWTLSVQKYLELPLHKRYMYNCDIDF